MVSSDTKRDSMENYRGPMAEKLTAQAFRCQGRVARVRVAMLPCMNAPSETKRGRLGHPPGHRPRLARQQCSRTLRLRSGQALGHRSRHGRVACKRLLGRGWGCFSLFDQVCLELKFLTWREIDFGVEALIAGQADGDFSMAGSYQQAFSDASKFRNMADKLSVDEDCGPLGSNRHFDFRKDRRHLEARIFFHLH